MPEFPENRLLSGSSKQMITSQIYIIKVESSFRLMPGK